MRKSTKGTLLTEGRACILGEEEDARGWARAVVLDVQNVPSSRTFQKMKLPPEILPPLGPVLGEPCFQAERGDGTDLKPHKLTL